MNPDPIQPDDLRRVIVVGSSCAGKTTFARDLAQILKVKHIELDQIHWLPDWQERPVAEFRELVEKEVAGEKWVLDGNYSKSYDITWPRATAVVWLDYSFPLVFYRTVKRTTRRVYTKETLFAGNVENFRNAFLSTDSMILWVIRTFRKRRRQITERLNRWPEAKRLIFRRPGQAAEFLHNLREEK